jgi:hypothetical protein
MRIAVTIATSGFNEMKSMPWLTSRAAGCPKMQDSCSYRFGLVNLGGGDRRDIADRFRECRQRLPFGFAPGARAAV